MMYESVGVDEGDMQVDLGEEKHLKDAPVHRNVPMHICN